MAGAILSFPASPASLILNQKSQRTMTAAASLWTKPHADVYHLSPTQTAAVSRRCEPAVIVSGELIILRPLG